MQSKYLHSFSSSMVPKLTFCFGFLGGGYCITLGDALGLLLVLLLAGLGRTIDGSRDQTCVTICKASPVPFLQPPCILFNSCLSSALPQGLWDGEAGSPTGHQK